MRTTWMLAMLLLTTLGCGQGKEPRAIVSGTLLNAGKPLEVAGEEAGLGYVQVQFYRIDDQGVQTTDPESARVAKDGSYKLQGKEGNGVAPGKYRVVARQWDPYPTDKLQGKFDEQNSPLYWTVLKDTVVNIDLERDAREAATSGGK